MSGFGCVSNRCRKLNVPLHCAGTPSSADCSANDPLVAIPGCTLVTSGCFGAAVACESHTTATGGPGTCVGQKGCQWNYASNLCSGTPTPCTQIAYYSEQYCTVANGCKWVQNSTGSPTPCSQLSTTQCASQPGCQNTTVGVY